MIIVHTPSDGGEVERFDVKTVRTAEASRIATLLTEKMSWPETKKALTDENPDVMRVIGFVIKCRANPELRLADFDPMVADLAVRLDRKEIEDWAEVAAGTIALTDQPDLVQMQTAMIIDEADDKDHARLVVERLLAGKFPPAPSEATPDASSPTIEESTNSEPGSSASSPTSSTSTEPALTT